MDKWLKTGSLKRKSTTVSEEDLITESDSLHTPGPSSERSTKTKKKVTRKYDEAYIKLGFTWTGNESKPKPQCVLCYEVLANESLKPANMRRHLETKHEEFKNKPEDFFKRKLNELNKGKKIISSVNTKNEKLLEISYLVSLRIAKLGKAHTIGENLVLPAAKDIVRIMIGEKAEKDLNLIPLSNDTVSRRIREMACDVETQLINRVRDSVLFSLQLDESTDIANTAHLMCYVKYIFQGSVHEDFLFCNSLSLRTTAKEIFTSINTYIIHNKIDWKRCVGVCSDGARAMLGKHGGVMALLREIIPDVTWIHCNIHRQALACKRMPSEFQDVLDTAVKIINFIKARPMNSRLFFALCDEMGSEYKQLLLHTEVRWLSRGKILTRLFHLRQEVMLFLIDSKFEKSDCLRDEKWLIKLAYLSDIFSKLNELNLQLQGPAITLFDANDKVHGFIKKLDLWIQCAKKQNIESFSLLETFLNENNLTLHLNIAEQISSHLFAMKEQFEEYYPENFEMYNWVRNPFSSKNKNEHLPIKLQEDLIEINSDGVLKFRFENSLLTDFWIQIQNEYPELAQIAIKILMPYSSSYLCETGFSSLVAMKTKYRSRLDITSDIRLKLTKTVSQNINTLCKNKQAHPSH